MAHDNAFPTGIAGLSGREPISALLTVSRKDPRNGAPIEKDRMHIQAAEMTQGEFFKKNGEGYKAPVHLPHPSFAAFNTAEPVRRRSIPAKLAHVTLAECFEYSRKCDKAPAWTNANGVRCPAIPAHPKKAPVCIGNGIEAKRWNGTEYVTIPCPGDQCMYAAHGPRNDYTKQPEKCPCGPAMRFIARFDFPPTVKKLPDGTETVVRLPSVPFKFASKAWNTTREFVGFFDAFKRTCAGFGVDYNDVPLFGMPIVLTLTERLNMDASPPSRFPVVSIQMGGDADLIAWIEYQLQKRQHLLTMAKAQTLPALTDRDQQAPEVLAADFEVVAGPTIAQPGQG